MLRPLSNCMALMYNIVKNQAEILGRKKLAKVVASKQVKHEQSSQSTARNTMHSWKVPADQPGF
jgi:hypothetical protein